MRVTNSCLFGGWERGPVRLNLRGLETGAGGTKGQMTGTRGQRQEPEVRVETCGRGSGGKDQGPEPRDQSPRPKRGRRVFQLFEQLDDIITRYIDPHWADRGCKTRGGEHGPREPLDRIQRPRKPGDMYYDYVGPTPKPEAEKRG